MNIIRYAALLFPIAFSNSALAQFRPDVRDDFKAHRNHRDAKKDLPIVTCQLKLIGPQADDLLIATSAVGVNPSDETPQYSLGLELVSTKTPNANSAVSVRYKRPLIATLRFANQSYFRVATLLLSVKGTEIVLGSASAVLRGDGRDFDRDLRVALPNEFKYSTDEDVWTELEVSCTSSNN